MKKAFTSILVATLFIVHSAFTPVGDGSHAVDTTNSTVTWTATKVTGSSHTGTVAIKSGSFDVKGGSIVGGEFVIDMTSINCTDLKGGMKDKLEGHLASPDFFDVKNHATATLKINGSEGHGDHMHINGELTIKGITKKVSFDANLVEKDGGFTAMADITVDRTQFDIRYGSDSFFDNLGDKAISNNMTFKVSLSGKAK